MECLDPGKSGLKVSRICLGCMKYDSFRWRDCVPRLPT